MQVSAREVVHQAPINDLDPVEFDKIVRNMLQNWAVWQSSLQGAIPSPVPSRQPMFRELKSGYNVEDDKEKKNIVMSRYEEAEYSESVITRMSEHDKSVLIRYFVKHKSTVTCSAKMGMSRRQFEKWLNTAVGKFAARVEIDDEGMLYVFQNIVENRRFK